MKKLISAFSFFILIWSFTASAQKPIKVTYRDIVHKVRTENLEVQQNALKVYQANQAISVARGNLLPKLNLWRIISVVFDPTAAFGLVGDIAPFLIPANWFQLKAQKEFYAAEVEGYRVLWANQVMTAKSLYLQLQYDQMLLVRVQSGRGDMERIHEIVKNREALGGYPAGTSREIEIRLLALDEDVRALKALIADEVSVLGIMLGYGATARVQIDPVELVDFEQHTPVRYDDYEKRVLNASSEIRQFYYLENAARQVRREVSFSIFGVSTLSRGVASGVFDNVPIQDGLGFGTAASIKISKAQVQTIALQRQGVAETLKRQLMQAVTNYNLDIANYPGVKKRVSLAKAVNEQLFERLRLGGDVDMLNLLEGSRNYIQAGTSKLNAQIRFLRNQDKIFRLALTSDYSGDPLSGRKP